MFEKVSVFLDSPTVSTEEYGAVDDDNVFEAPIMADKDILQESRREDTLESGEIATEGYLSMIEKMPHRGIRAHYEKLSEFERGRIIELKEAGCANQGIARHMGRSDVAIRR
ncbi:hypothetical protein TNCV_5075991 [Trichonephila clavipes]|uniref:Transposase IS30-like HTH domain-containing protein n=1 Tax=Trichonephila clavipes TaxID=2585209 RepID=A0A8X6V1K1_TRICX|nr:hypothetical protein TNCV_5075991 [Trichonephila clavipes]